MADAPKAIDLSNSTLILEGEQTELDVQKATILRKIEYLKDDQDERKKIYNVRRDMYVGNHAKYTNIVDLQNKEKKGHANAVINYAGKTATKLAYALSNNPPHLTFPVDSSYKPDDEEYNLEEARTQASEDFVFEVLRRNKFWKRAYRRAVFNQIIPADFAIKVYPYNTAAKGETPNWEIKIVNHEKMENLMVGWRGDDAREFDFVISSELRSLQSIKDEWGIVVQAENVEDDKGEKSSGNSSHNDNNQWGTKNVGLGGRAILPSGKNTIPSAWVYEYDDENIYAILINKQLVQLVHKDGTTMPKMKFWIIGENIPNPGFHWSISDLDYIIDANIELNEASNEERDYVRVGANQKFVAYNMPDFDPESVKTGSGGVIFVDSPDGTAKFETLNTNVNTYPADTYLTRIKKHIHDLGIPEVTFGSAGADSGRSKALDYQSFVDVIDFKEDAWELALTELCEKLQILGSFYFKQDFFNDVRTGELKMRLPDFDWSDIVPITQSDKIVNIVNKVQMGLPFREAYKELGYRDVDALIAEMKKESQDPELMIFRSKMWQLAQGIQQAQPQMPGMPGADPNQQSAGPTLTSSQGDTSLPVSQSGGTTAYSTPNGVIDMAKQNMAAKGMG